MAVAWIVAAVWGPCLLLVGWWQVCLAFHSVRLNGFGWSVSWQHIGFQVYLEVLGKMQVSACCLVGPFARPAPAPALWLRLVAFACSTEHLAVVFLRGHEVSVTPVHGAFCLVLAHAGACGLLVVLQCGSVPTGLERGRVGVGVGAS